MQMFTPVLVVSGKSYHWGKHALLICRTVRWEDVPKVDDRPVAYVAAGSHGVWSTPGHHVYADVSPAKCLVIQEADGLAAQCVQAGR